MVTIVADGPHCPKLSCVVTIVKGCQKWLAVNLSYLVKIDTSVIDGHIWLQLWQMATHVT